MLCKSYSIVIGMTFSSFLAFFSKMSSLVPSSILGPVGVRGMTVLDRNNFLRTVQVPVIKVKGDGLSKISQLCKAHYLKLENFKPVQESGSDDEFKKHIHLNPEQITQWLDIEEKNRMALIELGINENNFCFKEVKLGYDNWTFNTIFKAVLPENEDIVSSFSQIGHIIHLNLRDHLLQYRPLIGQVLVDKIKTCRTVVNKNNIIDNTYRNFSMEVIAGEEDFLVTVKENKCTFQFDFSKVYWNSRLAMEHERILGFLKPNDVLFDVFCGVGPFSLPAAKIGCKVYANDLNSDSFKWLNHNASKNKLKGHLQTYNLDGKDFICNNIKEFVIKCCKGTILQEGVKVHVTMNLPAMAVEFLKYFRGLVKNEEFIDKFKCDIKVYVYCFVGEDPFNAAKKLVSKNLDCDMTPYIVDIFNVRKVSPKKDMMRVTFNLTKDILFDTIQSENGEPPVKKLCSENLICKS